MLYVKECIAWYEDADKFVCGIVDCNTTFNRWSGFTIVRPIYLPQNEPVVHFLRKRIFFSVIFAISLSSMLIFHVSDEINL